MYTRTYYYLEEIVDILRSNSMGFTAKIMRKRYTIK